MSPQEPLIVWTDGACLGNPGPGGWAWARSKTDYASGSEPMTTNQRMELLAVIEALAAHPGQIEIRSDSTYVVNCFKDRWWVNWRARGWRNSQGKPVANQDLWERLIGEVVDHRPGEITFTWVKGHANDVMNNVADELCTAAARLQRPAYSQDQPILPGHLS